MSFLILLGPKGLAQDTPDYNSLNKEIEILIKNKDTTRLAQIFGTPDILKNGAMIKSSDYLNFKLHHGKYLSSYSKVSADSVLHLYKTIEKDAEQGNQYEVLSVALERIATTYRSKKQLDKAFEYNQKEIRAAEKSGVPILVASALITELDITYNSLPWPIQKEDLNDLVVKSEYVINYAKENDLNDILSFGKLYLSKFYIKQEAFQKAQDILLSISDNEPLNVTFSKYEHLCEIAKETQNLEAYRTYTLAFKRLAYETKRPFVALNAHNYLLDYSIRMKNKDSASYYAGLLEKNLLEVDTTKYLGFLDVTYATLARHFSSVDTQQELKYTSYSATINKLIADRQRQAFTAILKYKTEVASLEKENVNLESSKTFFKNNFWRLMGVFLLALIGLFFLYRKFTKTKTKVALVNEEKELLVEKVSRKSIELNNKQRIYLDELKYLKADRNYVEFHTKEKRYVDRNILSAVLETLPPNFVQTHRSYVINKNFIKSTTSSLLILSPDVEIPISRTFKGRLKGDL